MTAEIGEGSGAPPSPARRALRAEQALWAELLSLATVVETALVTAVRALVEGRADLAGEVKQREREVDRWEVRDEQECLRILALYDLTASDLRRTVTVLKVNRDLERLADLAAQVARKAKKLSRDPGRVPAPEPLNALLDATLALVRDGFRTLADEDPAAARAGVARDRQVERDCRALLKRWKLAIPANPEDAPHWLRLMGVARNLEHIACHLRTIAEAVVYMKEGRIIRHDDPPTA